MQQHQRLAVTVLLVVGVDVAELDIGRTSRLVLFRVRGGRNDGARCRRRATPAARAALADARSAAVSAAARMRVWWWHRPPDLRIIAAGFGPPVRASARRMSHVACHSSRSRSRHSPARPSSPGRPGWRGLPVRSGRTDRHRLDRGGNPQINAAIHRVAVTPRPRSPARRASSSRATRPRARPIAKPSAASSATSSGATGTCCAPHPAPGTTFPPITFLTKEQHQRRWSPVPRYPHWPAGRRGSGPLAVS